MKVAVLITLLLTMTSCETSTKPKLTPESAVKLHCDSCGGLEKIEHGDEGVSAQCKNGMIHAYYEQNELILLGSCKR